MAMLDRAAALGYDWLVVTERSRGVDARRGLDNAAVQEWLAEEPPEHNVRLLRGVEVEITPDGMLDIDHRLLAHADWVIGALHHDVDTDPDANTQRLIWGLESGVLSCLGAPTGRRVGHEGIPMYFEEVVACCVDFGVALELNGHPSKIDLNAQLAGRARALGAMLVAGSEATSSATMQHIEYATQQARRAWFEPGHLLNCLSADDLIARVRSLVN